MWDDVGDRLKLIDVQMPFDIYSEDESLAVLQTIAKDYDFFEFYLRFGRDHAVEMCGGRTWPTVYVEGHIAKMPSFYVYVIDIEVDNEGQRTITVGLAHWLLGIYAEIEIVFRIYPEHFASRHRGNLASTTIYLPFVSFIAYTEFKLEYVEQENLTRQEIIAFIKRTVQDILDFTEKNCNCDKADLTKLIHDLNSEKSIWLSTRLLQILLYNQRLVRIVRDYMVSLCNCVPDADETYHCICYCNAWSVEEIKNFNTIYFIDAKLICSNEVFFTPANTLGYGTA